MTRLRLAVAAAALLALLAGPAPARGHESRPPLLVLREQPDGRWSVRWSPPEDAAPDGAVGVRFSPEYRASGRWLDCSNHGLPARVGFTGLGRAHPQALVQILAAGRPRRVLVATADAPELELASPASAASAGAVARSYLELGATHVLSGLDHLAFVAGLFLLVSGTRRLLVTLTAFTLAHATTLALAALELVRVPAAPVELAIALSVVLVAREALAGGDGLARRRPWLVAASFGLVHGLGFAGAIAEVGLPPRHAALALATFNAGVELGQLAVVLLLAAVAAAAHRWPGARARAATVTAYALGALGMAWTIARLVATVRA